MRFRLEQRLPAPPGEVQEAVLDPAYLERLASLPKLGQPELLSQDRGGTTVIQRVRYAFAGELSSGVRKVVDPERLTWVEVSEIDVASNTTHFDIEPDHYGSMLTGSGVITITSEGEAGSLRTAKGEVSVRVPLVGGKVERAIVSGLEDHASAEEGALRAWLADR